MKVEQISLAQDYGTWLNILYENRLNDSSTESWLSSNYMNVWMKSLCKIFDIVYLIRVQKNSHIIW